MIGRFILDMVANFKLNGNVKNQDGRQRHTKTAINHVLQ